MAVTVSVYDYAATIFSQGLINIDGDPGTSAITSGDTFSEFKVALFNDDPSAPFTATDTDFDTLTGTEVSTGGYPAGGVALTNPFIYKSGNDSYFDADDFSFTAVGSSIDANWAVLYVTEVNRSFDPTRRPLLHINFGQVESAAASTAFKIVWSAQGIFSFVVA